MPPNAICRPADVLVNHYTMTPRKSFVDPQEIKISLCRGLPATLTMTLKSGEVLQITERNGRFFWQKPGAEQGEALDGKERQQILNEINDWEPQGADEKKALANLAKALDATLQRNCAMPVPADRTSRLAYDFSKMKDLGVLVLRCGPGSAPVLTGKLEDGRKVRIEKANDNGLTVFRFAIGEGSKAYEMTNWHDRAEVLEALRTFQPQGTLQAKFISEMRKELMDSIPQF
jgi:hypothetical protein